MALSPTPLRISTMTALCDMGCDISLDDLYRTLQINDVIKCVEYQDNPVKGVKKKKKKKKNVTSGKKKCFYNQLTVIIHIMEKDVNVKIFKNGKIQITGIKTQENGIAAAKHVSSIIKDSTGIKDYRTVLINSDFNIGFPIRRNELYNILVKKYNLFVSFEPCIYPGVNAKYFWNTQNSNYDEGVCMCTHKCSGKGQGNGNGDCKRITMSSFQSGTVIITGANTIEQLHAVHKFLLMIFAKHKDQIQKKIIV